MTIDPTTERSTDQQLRDACTELERSIRSGQGRRVEELLAAFPDVAADTECALELVFCEFDTRRRLGQQPRADEWFRRFPEMRDRLQRLFELDGIFRTQQVTPASLSDTLFPGESASAATRCQGNVELLTEVGRGGMGVVFRARDRDLQRELAVKVLAEQFREDAGARRRFVEEARIAGQLQHPGIAPIHELGELSDGRPYFSMKLIEGQTLAALLEARADHAEDRPRFLKILEAVSQTVAYAHSRGVIHRDLKPANVMVGAFGEVQVMDWGLAKVLGEKSIECRSVNITESASDVDTTVTSISRDASQDGAVLGTMAYMAPEQARGKNQELDQRCDVFGLGAILCEILTGRPPFAATGELGYAVSRLGECGADTELVALARRWLAHESSDRPEDAGVVATELRRYLDSVEARLHNAELARAEAQAIASEERKRRRLTVFLAVALTGLVAVIGATAWWAQRQRTLAAVETARRETEVEQALAEARRYQAADNHSAALAAIRQAEGRMQGGAVSETLQRAATHIRADLDLLTILESIRLRQAELRPDGRGLNQRIALPLYRDVFKRFESDPTVGDVAEVAASLKARSIWPNLRAALYDWIAVSADQPEQQRLLNVLHTAGSDHGTWERSMLEFVVRRDRTMLPDLIRTMKTQPLTAAELAWVARVLLHGDLHTQAEDWLRVAYKQYPGDFWINLFLAVSLHTQKPPQFEEAIQHYTAALALRPQSASVYINLANALAQHGRLAQAVSTYQKALELEPGNGVTYYNLGNTLMFQARYADAADAFLKAIHLAPNLAEAHCNLGRSLAEIGRFTEALEAFRRGHELGSKQPTWRYPSEEWIRNTERLIEIDAALPDFLAGDASTADPSRQAEVARCLAYKQHHAAAARLYQRALTASPSLAEDRKEGYRFQAARAAAFAAAGIGDDSTNLDAEERGRWRKQAVEWLRAELELTVKPLGKNDPQTRAAVLRTLLRWREDIAFAEWRDPAALATFSEDERVAGQSLWNELNAIRGR